MPSSWEYFTGHFKKCPNCDNETEGDFIAKCDGSVFQESGGCGRILCKNCQGSTLMIGSTVCPNCDGIASWIGEIKPESPDENDGDVSDDFQHHEDNSVSFSGESPSYLAPTSSVNLPSTSDGSLFLLLVGAILLVSFLFSSKEDTVQKIVAPPASMHSTKASVASGGATSMNEEALVDGRERHTEEVLVKPNESFSEDTPTSDLNTQETHLSPVLPPGEDGVVVDIEHAYHITGQEVLGAHIFIEFSNQRFESITLTRDMEVCRGDHVRVVFGNNNRVEVIKLPED